MTVSLPEWGIMGVVVAAVVLIIMIVFAVRFISWSKMDSDSEDDSDSDSDSETDGNGGGTGDGAAGGNHVQRELVTARSVAVNLRVMRGPDWRKGDQDGGEGNVGTVLGFKFAGGSTQGPPNMARLLNRIPPLSAVVVWDTPTGPGGRKLFYAIGCNGEHHLSVAPRDRVGGVGGGSGMSGTEGSADGSSTKFFWRSATEGERVAGGVAYAEPPDIDVAAQAGEAPRDLTGEEVERWQHFGADNAWGMGVGGGWSGVPNTMGDSSLKKRHRGAAGGEKGRGQGGDRGRNGKGGSDSAASGRKSSKFQVNSPAWRHGGAQSQLQSQPQRGLGIVKTGGTMTI